MSTNDEQYDDPEESQDEEAELSEDDLEEAAGGIDIFGNKPEEAEGMVDKALEAVADWVT